MMTTKKDKGLNPVLEHALNKLLTEVMSDAKVRQGNDLVDKYSLTDKMKVLDRVLKLEAIKLKMNDDSWGKGLFGGDDDESGVSS